MSDVALDVPDELCLDSHMCPDEWLNHMPNKDPAINRESTSKYMYKSIQHNLRCSILYLFLLIMVT